MNQSALDAIKKAKTRKPKTNYAVRFFCSSSLKHVSKNDPRVYIECKYVHAKSAKRAVQKIVERQTKVGNGEIYVLSVWPKCDMPITLCRNMTWKKVCKKFPYAPEICKKRVKSKK